MFTEQTKATVKTNNKTIELPLLITIATTSPLKGLDWMQRLGIHLNANNSELQIHNINLETKKSLTNIQGPLPQRRNQRPFSKKNLKEGTKTKQQKGRPIPTHLQDQVAKELKRLLENGYLERATLRTEDYEPRS